MASLSLTKVTACIEFNLTTFMFPENIFQFRYLGVPMSKYTLGAEGEVIKEETFTLKRLEVIGRIENEGLDIEVSYFQHFLHIVRDCCLIHFLTHRPAAVTLVPLPRRVNVDSATLSITPSAPTCRSSSRSG